MAKEATATTGAAAAAASTTSAADAAAAKAAKAAKALRKYWQTHHPYYFWWTVAAVIGLFTLANVVRIATQYNRRRRALKLAQSTSEKNEFGSASANKPNALSRSVNSTLTATRKVFSWREFTIALYWKTTAGELFWSVWYCAIVFLLGLIYLPLTNGATRKTQATMIGNRCGLLAFAQLPLIVGLASKNQVISYLTGISYEKLNFLHRAAGRACLLLSWIHTIERGMVLTLSEKNAIYQTHMVMGCVALISVTLLIGLSIKPFLRRVAYEVFLVSHIVFAFLFLLGSWMHWDEFDYYVYPAFIIWGFDRFVRFANTVFLNKLWLSLRPASTNENCTAVVKCLADNAISLTVKRSMSWKAGQHAYVICPTVSKFPFEAHPFTISSIPKADEQTGKSEVSFIISQRDGFTGRLGQMAKAAGGQIEITALLDGPYGYVRGLNSNHSVVLISGGSGITYTLPLLLDLVKDAQSGKSAVKNITFVWVVRTTEQIDWIAAPLYQAIRDCPSSLNIDLKLFVTRSTVVPILNEKAALESGSEGTSPRDSSEITPSTVTPASPNMSDEKKGDATPGALLFATSLNEGRPDFAPLLREVITSAAGGAVAVNVCGPEAMSGDIKTAMNSRNGAFSLGEVASGKVGIVDLHVESFGW